MGIGECGLGLVTVFCHPDQARMEACDAFFTLCQHDLSQPSMVVVRRYSNTPYIPRGTSCALYLDMGTLSGGHCFHPIPLDRLHLFLLLSFSKTKVLLPSELGGESLKMYPISQSSYGIVQRRNIVFLVPSLCQFPHQLLLSFWKCASKLRED